MKANPTLSPRHARRNLTALEKPNDDYYLTKTIFAELRLRAVPKTTNFQARQTTDRARPNGRGLARSFDRRFVVPRDRTRQVRASSFLDFPWLIRARANRHVAYLR